MLRSIEACGKAGVFGLRYLSQGKLEKKYFYRFVRNEMLRREYLNQTFLVLPEMQVDYNKIVHDADFEKAQMEIFSLKGEDLTDNNDDNGEYSNENGRKKGKAMVMVLIIDKVQLDEHYRAFYHQRYLIFLCLVPELKFNSKNGNLTYSDVSFEESEKSLVDIEKRSERVKSSRILTSNENVIGLGQSYISLVSSSHIPVKSNATQIYKDKNQVRKKRQTVAEGMYSIIFLVEPP